MKINKKFILLTLFSFLYLIGKISLAEEVDYEHLLAGECVQQEGFFFNKDGMVKLIVNIEEKIKTQNAESQKQLEIIKIDLESCKNNKQTELRIQKEMFEKQLLIKQQVIDSHKTEIFWSNIKIVAYTTLGVGVGLLIGGLFIK